MNRLKKSVTVLTTKAPAFSKGALLLLTISSCWAVVVPAQAEWGTGTWLLEGFHFGCTVPTTAPMAPSCTNATVTLTGSGGLCAVTSWAAVAAQDPTGLWPVSTNTTGLLIQHGAPTGITAFLPAACTLTLESELGKRCTALPDIRTIAFSPISTSLSLAPIEGSSTLRFQLNSAGLGVLRVGASALCPEGYGPFMFRPMSDLTVLDMRSEWDDDLGACHVDLAFENQGQTGWDGHPSEQSPSFYAGGSDAFVTVQVGENADPTTFTLANVDPDRDLETGTEPVIFRIPESIPGGSTQITAIIDSTNDIVEVDDGNQTLTKSVVCALPSTPPDIRLDPLYGLLREIENLELVWIDNKPGTPPEPCWSCPDNKAVGQLTQMLHKAKADRPYTLVLYDNRVTQPLAYIGRWNAHKQTLDTSRPADFNRLTTRKPFRGCNYTLVVRDELGREIARQPVCLDPD